MSHLKVASIRTFSIDLASYQPLPEHGYTPVSSSRPVRWLKHNIPVPKNADRENFDSAPLTVQPKSRFCLSYSLPLVQPNTLAESKPIREHDRPSILLQLLRSLSAAQAPEELTSIPSEAAHRALSSDISESKPSGTCNPKESRSTLTSFSTLSELQLLAFLCIACSFISGMSWAVSWMNSTPL